ncbi:MAG TPA: hypothetical protein VFZ44_06360 [Pyrinomonadaceae bacterium]
MSSEANQTGGPEAVAKQAPTEQQETRPGTPKRFAPGQTVCNEKNEKGKLCNGHLKEVNTQHPSRAFLRGDDTLHRCQACGALYMGPPLGHVRDPRKQTRYVERDLAAILQAAGGTLPAYEYPTPAWRGEPKPKRAPAAKPAAPRPAVKAAPTAAAETIATAATPLADSSASADAHRPAAEAQAATGEASAAPLSPTAATASPAAGAETVSDLATEASTELTPGAPKDERAAAAPAAPTAEAKPKAKKGGGGFKYGPEFLEQPGETFEQKVARLKRLVEEAKRAAGKL